MTALKVDGAGDGQTEQGGSGDDAVGEVHVGEGIDELGMNESIADGR